MQSIDPNTIQDGDLMINYVVEITTEITYRMRVSSDKSIIEVRNELWQQLEDTDPENIGAYVDEAYVQDVAVRPPYDWESV